MDAGARSSGVFSFFAPSVPVCAKIIGVKEYLKIYRVILMG